MENLIKQFEKESGISATIESELYADGEIYAKEYTEWLEKRIQALSMSGVSDPGEWDSTKLIGNPRQRFDQIKEDKGEWKGFYSGWIEGRINMLLEIKGVQA